MMLKDANTMDFAHRVHGSIVGFTPRTDNTAPASLVSSLSLFHAH